MMARNTTRGPAGHWNAGRHPPLQSSSLAQSMQFMRRTGSACFMAASTTQASGRTPSTRPRTTKHFQAFWTASADPFWTGMKSSAETLPRVASAIASSARQSGRVAPFRHRVTVDLSRSTSAANCASVILCWSRNSESVMPGECIRCTVHVKHRACSAVDFLMRLTDR